MKRHDLIEVDVHNFKTAMKLLAEHDLWDEMEDHLKSQGCKTILISVEPVEAIGVKLQQNFSSGKLRPKSQELDWRDCWCLKPPVKSPTDGGPSGGPDAGPTAPPPPPDGGL